jgi:periplasmic protein CpxP/Spy
LLPQDQTKEFLMNEQQTKQTSTKPNSKRRWTIAGIGGALAAGLITFTAFGNGGPGWHGHHGHGMMAEMSPEDASKRIDKMVNWVLDDVNATTEQKQRVAQIAKQAMQEMQPMRTQHKAARGRAVELLSQPSIDRTAIEQLRVEEMQLGEAASKRFTQAIADAAEVLTPEQRVKLAAEWKKRRG